MKVERPTSWYIPMVTQPSTFSHKLQTVVYETLDFYEVAFTS